MNQRKLRVNLHGTKQPKKRTTHPFGSLSGSLGEEGGVSLHRSVSVDLGNIQSSFDSRTSFDSGHPSSEQGERLDGNSRPVVNSDPVSFIWGSKLDGLQEDKKEASNYQGKVHMSA